MKRNRWIYAAVIAVVIFSGLVSRSHLAAHLPVFIATYAGDTLWALTVFLCLAFVFRGLRTSLVALVAIIISFSVEISQLYQAQWINTIRHTHVGALLLGAGFKWSDLLCYTVGVIIGFTGERLITDHKR